MKYYVKTSETELWTRSYVVEADSGDEAIERLKSWDSDYIDELNDEFCGVDYREILEVEPYEN